MSKIKYHINPKTGRPNQCKATVQSCRYAKDGQVPEHYDTKAEAQAAYEKQNEDMIFKKKARKANSRMYKVQPANQTDANIINLSDREDINNDSILHGRNLDEVVKNLENDYEDIEMAPRQTKHELIGEIADTAIINEDDYDATIITGVEDNTAFEDRNGDSYSETSLVLTHKTATVEKHDSDYLGIDDDKEKVSYTFPLTQTQERFYNNNERYKKAREYKATIDDPSRPNWTVLPPREDAIYQVTDEDVENINKRQEQLFRERRELSQLPPSDVIDNEIAENAKKTAQFNKDVKHLKQKMYEDYVSSRHPSPYSDVRSEETTKWMKENKDKLPNLNDSSVDYYLRDSAKAKRD